MLTHTEVLTFSKRAKHLSSGNIGIGCSAGATVITSKGAAFRVVAKLVMRILARFDKII